MNGINTFTENVRFCGIGTGFKSFGSLISTLFISLPKKQLIPNSPRKCVILWKMYRVPHYHKCGFLWNRYRVQKIGQLNTLSSYSLSHKQIISHSPRKCGLLWKMYPGTGVPQKMCTFVENVPGTGVPDTGIFALDFV